MRKTIRFVLVGVAVLAVALGFVGTAWAVDTRGGDSVTIGKTEVIDDDLLIGGERVVMDGTVNGNLFAAGTTVTINGIVNGSVFLAGQSLTVNGKVTGSVFGGGASLTLGPAAQVDRNLLFGGYTLTTDTASVVGRDALMGGLVATFNGEVGRDLKMGGEALEITGKVGRDVVADVGDATGGPIYFGPMPFAPGLPTSLNPGLRVGPEASIGGKLTYTADQPQLNTIQAQPAGGIAYQTPQPDRVNTPVVVAPPTPQQAYTQAVVQWILDRGRDLTTLLLLGVLMLWRWPSLITQLAETTRTQALAATGWGLLIVIAGYVAALIIGGLIFAVGITFLVATLGGLSGTVFGVGFSTLGLAVSLFTLLVTYGSKLIVAYLAGWLIVRAFASNNQWLALLVGVIVYVLVSGIPLFGWLFSLLATLLGVGATWLVYRQWQARHTPATRPAPPKPAAMPA
jgi:hypothetical protein